MAALYLMDIKICIKMKQLHNYKIGYSIVPKTVI